MLLCIVECETTLHIGQVPMIVYIPVASVIPYHTRNTCATSDTGAMSDTSDTGATGATCDTGDTNDTRGYQ